MGGMGDSGNGSRFGSSTNGLCFRSSAKLIRFKSGQTKMGHDVPEVHNKLPGRGAEEHT
jgi:hypothetical protein